MMIERLSQIALACGGEIVQGVASQMVRGIYTDTRDPQKGALFVALTGANHDGHDYIAKAHASGAAAVLISSTEKFKGFVLPGLGIIKVADTRDAFLKLGQYHRQKWAGLEWIGVTGSAGKTTTKEMISHILSEAAGWNVHRAKKSFNNEVGLPTTILGASPEHDAVVLELGTNHPGEIERLANVARPKVAVITNAGPCHLESLGSVYGVAEEKAHILDFQTKDNVAVLNASDPHFDVWRRKAKGRVITFGRNSNADLWAEAIEDRSGKGKFFFLCTQGEATEVQLAVPGQHNVLNALAAAACAYALGIPLVQIGKGLTTFQGAERRFQATQVNGITVVDDAYNANPLSFRAALDALRGYAGRRIFIVAGDMLELGREAEHMHDDLGIWLAEAEPDALLTVGDLATRAGRAAIQNGLPMRAWTPCTSPEEAADRLQARLQPNDVVLVKGSNGMNLKKCVERIIERQRKAS